MKILTIIPTYNEIDNYVDFPDSARFYGYRQLLLYIHGDIYDVLYVNPILHIEERLYSEIAALGISWDRILRIRINFRKVFHNK